MSNPIFSGFNPDPTICRVGKDYFAATSTFEYFPGVPIYHSTDLINWRLIGHALNRRSQLDMRCIEPGCGVWAPTLRYWKGRFYLATCVVYFRTQRPIQPDGFFVSTDNIWDQNTWTDPIYFDQMGIDQDLFFDDDNRVYLCTARFTVSPVQGRGTNSISPPVLLRSSEVLPGLGSVAEGPHIYKKDGYYYLLTAEGGTGPRHHVIVTRSDQPLGTYLPQPVGHYALKPVLSDKPGIQRTGHADLVQAEDGKWWSIMLGIRRQAGGTFQLGKESFLAPVEWSEDGWPSINSGKPITTTIPAGLPAKILTADWSDDFDSDNLSPGIYEEAGTTVFYSGISYAAIIISKGGDDHRKLTLRYTDPSERKVKEISRKFPSRGSITLQIAASPNSYDFRYQLPGAAAFESLGELTSKVLDGGSDMEFEFYFTGAHFGVFAQATNGEPCQTPAHFSYAKFSEEIAVQNGKM